MLRTTLANAYIKRTIRPAYAFSQATPKSQFLDPAWTQPYPVGIFPGMVMMKTVGENIMPIGGMSGSNAGSPYGFASFFEGGDNIYEISEQGVNACACWVLGPDAEFEILAPAFDTSSSWVEPTDGSIALVYAFVSGAKQGLLCPSGATGGTVSTAPVARLISVDSATQITIGGLQAHAA